MQSSDTYESGARHANEQIKQLCGNTHGASTVCPTGETNDVVHLQQTACSSVRAHLVYFWGLGEMSMYSQLYLLEVRMITNSSHLSL